MKELALIIFMYPSLRTSYLMYEVCVKSDATLKATVLELCWMFDKRILAKNVKTIVVHHAGNLA